MPTCPWKTEGKNSGGEKGKKKPTAVYVAE